MKRVDLVRLMNVHGCRIIRHGARHDIFLNPRNQRRAPIPRHREIPDSLVKIILKQLGLGNP